MSDYDFKKDWPKIKKDLARLSQEALTLAKKGEEQLVKLSHKGKLQLDAAALGLKKEHLYHLVGKEYFKSKCACPKSPKMQQLLNDLHSIDKEQKELKKKIKTKAIVEE